MDIIEIEILLIGGSLCGIAGMKIAEVKGYAQIPAFWISALFGPFGLIYLSTGTASNKTRTEAQG